MLLYNLPTALFYFSFLKEYLSFLFTVSKTENFVEILDTSVRLGP